ncbi:hypothetical protein D3C73_1516560 [compost metagenome]
MKLEQSKVAVLLRLAPNSYGVPQYFMPAAITFSTAAWLVFDELLPEVDVFALPLTAFVYLDEEDM